MDYKEEIQMKKRKFCKKHKIPMLKNQTVKIGDNRFYCIKCKQENSNEN